MQLTYFDEKYELDILLNDPETFWKGITSIGQNAFAHCPNLNSIDIPDEVLYIDEYAFYKCKNLKSIRLPNSIIEIASDTFYNSGLERVDLPFNVERIGDNAFFCCNLTEVNFNPNLKYIGKRAFTSNDIKKLKFFGPIEIDFMAFDNNSHLNSIEFNETIGYVHSKAFKFCSDIKTIKIGEKTITIDDQKSIYSLQTLDKNTLAIISKNNDDYNFYELIVANGQETITIENIKKSVIQRCTIDEILFWYNTKQKSDSKAIKNARLPEGYVMKALGKDEQLINAFYKTKSNGWDKIEQQPWMGNGIDNSAKQKLVTLFAVLGGFEDNAAHQMRVVMFIDQLTRNLIIRDGPYWDYSSFYMDLEAIPNIFDCIREQVTIYAHDKDNNVIMENGFPKIKSEKIVSYHNKLLTLFENSLHDEEFFEYAPKIIKEFPKIYKAYKQRLAFLNPARNPKGNEYEYNELKQKGLNFEFCKYYFIKEKYNLKNQELANVVSFLTKEGQTAKNLSIYDEYLTKAKEITQNAIKENKRPKVFVDNVIDQSDGYYSYFFPPITSAMALTIGNRFDTCYSVNRLNEVGLLNVITQPQDNIIIIMDEKKNPIAYCRINYDEKNKGILIDNIELDKHLTFVDRDKLQIWNACVRALKDMKVAMNTEGKYPVERIYCKPDPYNKVFKTISSMYMKARDLKAVKLEERHYKDTENSLLYDEYYASYDTNRFDQLVIDSPELDKFVEATNLGKE